MIDTTSPSQEGFRCNGIFFHIGVLPASRHHNDSLHCWDRHVDPDRCRLGNIDCKSNFSRRNQARSTRHRNVHLLVRVPRVYLRVRKRNMQKCGWRLPQGSCSLGDWEPWRAQEVVLDRRVVGVDEIPLKDPERLV